MSSTAIDPSFYADFNGLTSLKKNVKANDPQAIRAAARQFESLFTEMVLKSMREAKLGEGLGESEQSDFFQDMYDQQLALQISKGRGLGLADMLVQQLTRRGLLSAPAGGAAGTPPTGSPPTSSAAADGAVHARATGGTPGHGPAIGTKQSAGAARGAGASGSQRMRFIRSLEPYARRAAAQLGVSADTVIAQAALETGWGQHVPASADGSSSHNLFGIKAGASWGGPAVSAPTSEYGSGQGAGARVSQSFRAYGSVQQGVNDYVTLLRRQPGYQAALGTGEDTGAFARALARGGYASDPDYVHKLLATAATVRSLRGTMDATLTAANGSSATSRIETLKLAALMPISDDGRAA